MQQQMTKHVEQAMQLVDFRLGSEHFGVPIEMVREIIRKPDITTMPNAPEHMLGVCCLRGQIIPVIDLSMRFSMDEKLDDMAKVIIVEYGDSLVGIEVSDVSEVLSLNQDAITVAPAMATKVDQDCISGVGKLDGKLLIILDMNRLLAGEDEILANAELEETGGTNGN